jgi:hypothetical protein
VVLGPAYVITGLTKRLNLTAEDSAKVAYKDPIQGTKDGRGECRFEIDPNTMHPLHPTVVGDWNLETCSGLVYSFRLSPAKRPPRGIKHEHRGEITYAPPTRSARASTRP